MEQRNDWVDYAKALGILLVVYGHVARGVYNAGIAIPNSFYEVTDSVIYSFHMPLFFFLSGLFFKNSLSKRGGLNLTFSKIDTIFYPFVLWSILQGSIEVFLSNYTNGNLTFTEVFAFLWEPRGQFWFLYALFLFFIFTTLLFFCLKKILPSSVNQLYLLLFILSIALYLNQSLLPGIALFRYIPDNLVYFIFGIVFSLYYKEGLLSKLPQLSLITFMFVVLQIIFHSVLDMNYSDKGILSLLLGLISILFIVSLSLCMAKNPNRMIIHIGTASMAIYLMHILAGSGARVILKSFLSIDSYIIHLSLGFTAALLAPLLALFIIKRLNIPYLFSAPISKILFNLKNKK